LSACKSGALSNPTRQGTPEASARPPSVPRRAYYLTAVRPCRTPSMTGAADIQTKNGLEAPNLPRHLPIRGVASFPNREKGPVSRAFL